MRSASTRGVKCDPFPGMAPVPSAPGTPWKCPNLSAALGRKPSERRTFAALFWAFKAFGGSAWTRPCRRKRPRAQQDLIGTPGIYRGRGRMRRALPEPSERLRAGSNIWREDGELGAGVCIPRVRREGRKKAAAPLGGGKSGAEEPFCRSSVGSCPWDVPGSRWDRSRRAAQG